MVTHKFTLSQPLSLVAPYQPIGAYSRGFEMKQETLEVAPLQGGVMQVLSHANMWAVASMSGFANLWHWLWINSLGVIR